MAEHYDVLVIGSGPAGRKAAQDCNNADLSVAVIEDYGFGGTCPLRGCEPKKVLVDAAFTVARARDMAGHGLRNAPAIDWPELMRFNRTFVEPVSRRVETFLDHEGIASYFGRARFVGPNTIKVNDDILVGKYVVVATGAVPRPLETPGKEFISSSDDFLEMMEMPREIIFMGGGFISFELGHLAARAGARVTILEVVERPLAPFDPDLVGLLVKATEDLGVTVKVNCPVQAVERQDGRLLVRAGAGGELVLEADMVVHGAGRVPALDGLELDKTGVESTRRGVTVNEFMQSVSNPMVYAAGDAAATTHPLTPVATMEAEVAAHNIIHGNTRSSQHQGLPSAVYTYPPLAAVGLREDEAVRQRIGFKKYYKETSGWSEHKRIGLKHAGYKLLLDESGERVVGAHILGERADEMINIFGLAIQHGLTVSQLKNTIWAYPSFIYTLRYILP